MEITTYKGTPEELKSYFNQMADNAKNVSLQGNNQQKIGSRYPIKTKVKLKDMFVRVFRNNHCYSIKVTKETAIKLESLGYAVSAYDNEQYAVLLCPNVSLWVRKLKLSKGEKIDIELSVFLNEVKPE